MNFEVIGFCKMFALHKLNEIHIKLTFVNSNVPESDYILHKNKKQNNKNQSFPAALSLRPICFSTTDSYNLQKLISVLE